MLTSITKKVISGENLREDEAMSAMEIIMTGKSTSAQIAAFLTAMKMKGETVEEITGCAKVMRNKAEKVTVNRDYVVDSCGTGGDNSNTFNISTACAFIAAAAGLPVAKHGNRAVSSRCGSADVLEELGVNISLDSSGVQQCIDEIGIGFLFAQNFHKAMKYAAPTRRELGFRTIFNLLGPLTNPVDLKGHLLGVFDEKLTEPISSVLKNLGMERVLVVHGMDGLDEITTTTVTKVSELKDGEIRTYYIDPENYGIPFSNKSDLTGGDAKENALIIRRILQGEPGPKRDIVVLNSAALLYVGKKVDDIKQGIELAEEMIDSGKAYEKLEELVTYSREVVERAG